MKLYTIGVYDTDAESFYRALRRGRIDLLIDIRRRRAVRGVWYAFANAERLVAGLAERGIAYRHELGLAPDAANLALQHAADEAAKRTKHERTRLDAVYIERFRRTVLEPFDFAAFAAQLGRFEAAALLCIERLPLACHRSLVASPLAEALGAGDVVHLLPTARRSDGAGRQPR